MAEYWQKGETIDFANTGTETIKYGDVVPITGRIGVAGCDISPDKTGSVHVTGIYILPKASAVAFEIGQAVHWDSTAKNVTGTGNHPAGWVVEPAATADKTVKVKIG